MAHTVLEAGSYCDDEVIVDYLGGVLAGGRTPGGRDDRAVTWSNLITQMSAFQIRAHYLLYTSWAAFAANNPGVNLASGNPGLTLFVDESEFLARMAEVDSNVPPQSLMTHVLGGLGRLDLIDSALWGFGDDPATSTGIQQAQALPYARALWCRPSESGIELWGWGHGYPDISIWSAGEVQDDDPILTPLTTARVAHAIASPPP
ncbi:hypothetical protein AXA44_47660 [Rhodococcus sp. SC4]|nr:hypothetical protein AXA44_47660 [Rhodococcus sp. SC4]